jgi:hypothetical protein
MDISATTVLVALVSGAVGAVIGKVLDARYQRKQKAAYALAELLSRRGLERPCETLVAWAQRV